MKVVHKTRILLDVPGRPYVPIPQDICRPGRTYNELSGRFRACLNRGKWEKVPLET